MRSHLLASLALALAAVLTAATPALACLSCGCGGSGSSADLGAVGGAASIFSMGHRWLVQEGVGLRSITGTFNERGDWNPAPVGGSLNTVQSTLGVSYFPTLGTSVGLQVPVLANLTEFGQTPCFTLAEIRTAGVALALYPLSASRAAAAASLEIYHAIRKDGTQQAVIAKMQTRADLYSTLGYTPPDK